MINNNLNYVLLQRKTPQKHRKYLSQQQKACYLNCKQLHQSIILYEQVMYKQIRLTNVWLVGRVIRYTHSTSPKGINTRQVTICDQTQRFTVTFYQGTYDDQIDIKRKYIKIYGNIKVTGLHKFTKQFIVTSWKLIQDFNQITNHFLQCVKTFIHAHD